MLSKLRSYRPSHATVVAYLSLFVALGGSSYAAITVTGKNVKNRSLTAKDIKKNSLTTTEVKNRSLLGKDFKSGQLPAGPRGSTGATGDRGPAGRSALTPLNSGETERGVIGLDTNGFSSNTDMGPATSYPIRLRSEPTNQFIVGSDAGSSVCTGTSFDPTAPPDTLCVYPTAASNPTVAANSHAIIPLGNGTLGFEVRWSTTNPNVDTYFFATYAVTGA